MELDSERGRRSFAYGPGSLEPLLQEERGEVLAYVTDQVGVPRELVDGAGRVAWAGAFTAFGKVVEEQTDEARGWRVESPFRLLGQVYDEESGLSWTRFRCFDAETGRWLSADPLGLEAGDETFGFDGAPTTIVDALGLTKARRATSTLSEASEPPNPAPHELVPSLRPENAKWDSAFLPGEIPKEYQPHVYDILMDVQASRRGDAAASARLASRNQHALTGDWKDWTSVDIAGRSNPDRLLWRTDPSHGKMGIKFRIENTHTRRCRQ
jgi:RHS repeat-associated protein